MAQDGQALTNPEEYVVRCISVSRENICLLEKTQERKNKGNKKNDSFKYFITFYTSAKSTSILKIKKTEYQRLKKILDKYEEKYEESEDYQNYKEFQGFQKYHIVQRNKLEPRVQQLHVERFLFEGRPQTYVTPRRLGPEVN